MGPVFVFFAKIVCLVIRRGVAQPGSATALGAVGREFESLRPDQFDSVDVERL